VVGFVGYGLRDRSAKAMRKSGPVQAIDFIGAPEGFEALASAQ